MNRMNKRRGRTFLEPLQTIFLDVFFFFFLGGGERDRFLIMVFSDV